MTEKTEGWTRYDYGDGLVVFQRNCPHCDHGLLLAPARWCSHCNGSGFETQRVGEAAQ